MYVLSNEFSRERVRGIRERLGVEPGGGVGGSAASVCPGGNGTAVTRVWFSQITQIESTTHHGQIRYHNLPHFRHFRSLVAFPSRCQEDLEQVR